MPPTPADRNLLFGILALQMALVSRAQLITAMKAWVLDKARPLGQILCEQKVLTSDYRVWLEATVERHLALHGNDAEKSFEALGSVSAVRQDLQAIADADVTVSLGRLPATVSAREGKVPTVAASTPETIGTPTSRGLRFRIVRPHAEGGLGKVYVAHDEELHREVALKEIKDRHADDPESRSRFLLEAEITGGLEHPGIVPVYGLGQYADGRPFYAMRFIQGDSLKDAIERFHKQPDSSQTKEGGRDRNLELRRLLERFIDVCQAMQYAHDRGVLHRDLKPGNVMLGKYGETLVVDWGLAKATGKFAGRDAPTTDEKPALQVTSAGSETVAGTALGTPVYMSPEQAAGRLDLLGPASDVYSLGGTLFTLLTGKMPVVAKNQAALLEKVRLGDILRPRAAKADVDPALEAVCMKAMALEPADRYQTPRELADDIERWSADNPVSAWPEPWTVRTKRWMRHHQTFVTSSAASMVITLVALTVFLLWNQAEQNRRATRLLLAEDAIRTTLDQAEKSRNELHAILASPGGVFGLLNDPARWEGYIQSAQASLHGAQNLLTNAETGIDPHLANRAATLEELLSKDELERKLAENLEKIRIDRSVIVDNAFDHRGTSERYAHALAQADPGILHDPPVEVAARFAAAPIKEQLLAALDDWAYVAAVIAQQDLVERVLAIGRLAAPDPDWGDRLRRREIWHDKRALVALVKNAPAQGHSPTQLALIAILLPRDDAFRTAWLRRAQTQYPADFWLNYLLGHSLYKSDPLEAAGFFHVAVAVRPKNPVGYNALGIVLLKQKKVPEAFAAFQQAIDLDRQAPFGYVGLGNALRDQNKPVEASAAYKKAIELDPQSAPTYVALGNLLRDQKKPAEAVAAYRKAIDLNPQLANAYRNLGSALHDQKKLAEAAVAYQKAFQLDSNSALAYFTLAIALRDQGKLPEASAAFRKAIQLDPQFAPAYNDLGDILRDQKKLPEAIAAIQKAIDLNPQYTAAHNNLGLARHDQKKLPEAIAAYQKAIETDPKSAVVYSNLGNALSDQKKLPEAIAAFQKAIELNPQSAIAHSNLGNALRNQKKLPEAIAAYHKAIDLDPKFAIAYDNLGSALRDQNKLPEAVAAHGKAIELDPKLAKAYNNLGIALRRGNKVPDAIAAFHKAIQLDPSYIGAYNSLGLALRDQKKLPEAIAAYQKAIEIDPRFAVAYYNLGIALRDQKKLPEAIAAYQKAIDLDPDYAEAHCNLGHALKANGDFARALKAMQKGHDLGSRRADWSYRSALWIKQCEALVALEKRLAFVLEDKASATAGELLETAAMCRVYQKRYATAASLYRQAFKAQPGLADDFVQQYRYDAACAAALASTIGDTRNPPTIAEKAALRQQAREWLQADLDVCAALGKNGRAESVVQTEQRLTHWVADADFAGVRDPKALAELPVPEQDAWCKLWTDVEQLFKQIRVRITQTTITGTLTDTERQQVHEIKMQTGKTYVIDMKSTDLDSYLKLLDASGKLLAENDDIARDDLDVRLVFAPQADGVFRITATSFQDRGRGSYTLTIRAIAGTK